MVIPTTISAFPSALFAAIDHRLWGDLESLLTEDIVYERPGYQPLKGITQVMHFYHYDRVIAEGRHELMDITASNDRVSCHGRFTGRSKLNEPLDVEFCDFYVLKGLRLSFRKTFFYVPAV